MTLRELINQHPDKFYPQTWYTNEAFLDYHSTPKDSLPDVVGTAIHSSILRPPSAVQLAALWIEHPHDPIWERYLWCRDRDVQGQQVYVGQNGHGLEIHRHIHISSRFGIPVW